MGKQALQDYFDALERLKCGSPIVVPKGTRITNDAVALEAGRSKGSIKRARPTFAVLIDSIDEAALIQKSPQIIELRRLDKAKADAGQFRTELDAALGRELCLLRENCELKKEISRLTGRKIVPLRGRSPPQDGTKAEE